MAATANLTVQEYLDKHHLSQRIEEAVNATVRARAEEPVSYMAEVLQRASPSAITKVKARQIFDSQGRPSIEVDLKTRKGSFRAGVPSGEPSAGQDPLVAINKAVASVNSVISPALSGKDPTKQAEIDQLMFKELEKMEDKAHLGAHAILAVSIAVCMAGAAEKGVPLYQHIADLAANTRLVLPVPALSAINGGRRARNKLAVQEFTILPVKADSFAAAVQMATETYSQLREVIKAKYVAEACTVGNDGGFAPSISREKEALDLIVSAIDKAGHTGKVKIGMHVAASDFFTDARVYDLDFKTPNNDGKQKKMGADLATLYKELCGAYPIVAIGDPFDEEDCENFTSLNAAAGESCQIVGEDLLRTDLERIKTASQNKWCSALSLKMTQAGSVSGTIEAVRLAKEAGWGVIVIGDTEDSFLADVAVGLAAGQMRVGALCGSDRLAKYNQLLRIGEQLGDKAVYAGGDFRFTPWVPPSSVQKPATQHREIAPTNS